MTGPAGWPEWLPGRANFRGEHVQQSAELERMKRQLIHAPPLEWDLSQPACRFPRATMYHIHRFEREQ